MEEPTDMEKHERDLASQPPPTDPCWNNQVFPVTMHLTQEQLNYLGELVFDVEEQDGECESGSIYNLLVNAASAAGADLP